MSEPKGVAEYYDMTADDSEVESSVDCLFDGAVAGAVTPAASRVAATHTTVSVCLFSGGQPDDDGPAVRVPKFRRWR